MPLNLDYSYGGESEQYSFYRIPKVLFTAAHYRAVPVEAKVLYGLLLDRMALSARNGWLDEGRRVFIYFTLEDAMAMKYEMEDKVLKYYPAKTTETKMFIRALGEDQTILNLHPVKEDSFTMTVQGQTYTERKKAGEAIIAACQNMEDPEKPVELGEYRGFPMTLKFSKGTFQVVLKQNLSYTAELGEDVLGNITRINHALEKIPENLEEKKRFLTTLEGELVNAKEEAARDFPQEQELAEKSARLAELNAELDKSERSKKKPAREESEQETPTAEKPSIRQQLKDYAAPARADAGTERAPWRGPVR